jgi:hypothetical protein
VSNPRAGKEIAASVRKPRMAGLSAKDSQELRSTFANVLEFIGMFTQHVNNPAMRIPESGGPSHGLRFTQPDAGHACDCW